MSAQCPSCGGAGWATIRADGITVASGRCRCKGGLVWRETEPVSAAPVEQPEDDRTIVRDALHLLAKFEEQPILWPDGPYVFPGAANRACLALECLVARCEGEGARLRAALADLLDTVERGDEFKVRERSAAARVALAQSEGLPS